MSKEGRHHYIPIFYLKQWARDNKGRLCEFSEPYDRVKPRMTHPRGTGYVDGLNTVEGLPPAEARFLEDVFFQIADDAAAQALKMLLSPSPWNFTTKMRSGWSRFIMSLMVRNPESVQKYKEVAVHWGARKAVNDARSNIRASGTIPRCRRRVTRNSQLNPYDEGRES